MNKRLTPIKAIRKKCLGCSENLDEIRNCPCSESDGAIEKCFLYPYRMGKRPKVKPEYTPIKSIRKYCLWCCGGSPSLVKECPVTNCPLWRYRLGKRPTGVGDSDEIPLQSEKTAV
jgi:hypothetical protein